MTRRPAPDPSGPSAWLLRAVTSPARAAAILGDLAEEHGDLVTAGEVRHPRLWMERQVWRHILAEVGALAPASARGAAMLCRDAWRSLRATPGVTAFILCVLTLGISAATVTFSVVDAVVLRPLPFPGAGRLVAIEARRPGAFGNVSTSPVFLFDRLQSEVDAFESLAAVSGRTGTEQLDRGGKLETVPSATVTASLFDVLGVRPAMGQTFTAAHEVQGQDLVAVIGYELWQSHFGSRPDVIGESVRLAGRSVTILGVMPNGFTYPLSDSTQPAMWTPFVAPADERSGAQLSRYLHVVGRLSPNNSPAVAQAQVDAVVASTVSMVSTGPSRLTDLVVQVRPLEESLFGHVRGWMLLVLAAVALVMLVACANVANLLLTRSARRSRELAIRASLGASRRWLVASLLTESLALSLAAAAAGTTVAIWGVQAARAALPAGIPRAVDIVLDVRVLLTVVAAAVVTGLMFGAVPAWQGARQDLISPLRDHAPTTTRERRRWRATFLVAEVAFVAMLLVATTMLVTSFVKVTRVDLGFERSRLVDAVAAGPLLEVLREIEALPGVAAVGALDRGSAPLAMVGGFGGGATSMSVRRPGGGPAGEPLEALYLRVSPGYFAAAGIPIRRGRTFTDVELGRQDLAIIDDLAARALFGDDDPIGRLVLIGDDSATIVGVVTNVRMRGPEAATGAQAYRPLPNSVARHSLLVRTSAAPSAVLPAFESLMERRRGAGTPPRAPRLIDDAFRRITADRRFTANLMALFGALAMLIGAVGVYGVMASVVTQRMREIGIRLALGASSSTVVRQVLAEGAGQIALGIAIGLPAGLAASQLFSSLLFGVTTTDPTIYALVAAMILFVGLLASALPARRVTRIDPLITLKSE